MLPFDSSCVLHLIVQFGPGEVERTDEDSQGAIVTVTL